MDNKEILRDKLMNGNYVIKTSKGAIDTESNDDIQIDYYFSPYGSWQINGIKDITAKKAGYTTRYHYFNKGMETFTVLQGKITIIMNSKKFVLEEGDILNIEAWCPYSMTFEEENTVVRHMTTSKDGKEFELPDPVNCEDVDKNKINDVACKNNGNYVFEIDGIKMILKVGRWQLGGYKEVWEYYIDKGYQIQYGNGGDDEGLYMVKSGSIKVEVGEEGFSEKAEKDDIIHIPAGTTFSLTAVSEGCVIIDYNVACHLFRLLEMIEAAKDYFPEKLDQSEYIEYLFDANKVKQFSKFEKLNL